MTFAALRPAALARAARAGPHARGAPPRARPDRRAADPRPPARRVPGARPRRRHRARAGPSVRAGRRRPADRLERHRPDDHPARPGPRPRARPDRLAHPRRLAVDDLRDRRPAQGRRRRGRRRWRSAISRPSGATGSGSSRSVAGARPPRMPVARARRPGSRLPGRRCCSRATLAGRDRVRPRRRRHRVGSRSCASGTRALRFVAATAPRGGLVVLVSDFRGPRDWLRPSPAPRPATTSSPSRSAIRARTTCPTSAS